MVHRVEKYSDGGKVIMPPRNPPKPVQMPRPESGPKPKKIGKRYADGGSVTRGARKPTNPKPPPPPAPKSTRDTIAAPKPASAADAIRNQNRRKEQLLGLKNGGKVRRR